MTSRPSTVRHRLAGVVPAGWRHRFPPAVVWVALAVQASLAVSPAQDRSDAEGEAAPTGVNVGIADPAKEGELPELTSGLSQRAAKAISEGDWVAARAAYREMVGIDPENALARANLGIVEFQLGELESARENLEAAVRAKPGLSNCWTTLGLLHYRRNELYLAVSTLTRAIHEDPENARARNYLAVAAREIGWTTAAELELLRSIELQPGYAEAHFNLALMYLDRRPPAVELARRHYRKAIDLGAAPDSLVEKQLAGKTEPE